MVKYLFHNLRTKDPSTYEKELRRANPEYDLRRKEYQRDYLKQKKSSSKEFKWKANERAKKYFRNRRALILWLLGSECIRCGFKDERALQIDHVNGEGNKGGRKHGAAYYRIILESLEKGENKFQLLCANCNWIKRVEEKECYKRLRNPSLREDQR